MTQPDPTYTAILQRLIDAEAAGDPTADLVEELHARFLEITAAAVSAGGLPYPVPTDPVAQGADAIRALAEAIDDRPAIRLRTTTAQATSDVAGYTPKGMVWSVADYDTTGGTMWNVAQPTRIVIPRTGVYRITAKIMSASTIYPAGIQVNVNGSTDPNAIPRRSSQVIIMPVGSAGCFPSLALSLKLTAAQYVEIESLSEAVSLSLDPARCHAEIAWEGLGI